MKIAEKTFNSKAQTLENLRGKLKFAKVLPQFCFTALQWNKANSTISALGEFPQWMSNKVIVRSSSAREDSYEQSFAGCFTSVVDVQGESEMKDAIEKVLASFNGGSGDDQVFVQPMLNDVKVSGVAFTREPSNSGLYYVVNYDDQSGRTDTVTGGTSNELKTFYCSKSVDANLQGWQKQLINLLQELEGVFENDALDVEFAFDKAGELYLLQVRPLVMTIKNDLTIKQHAQEIKKIQERVEDLMKPHPYILGDRTVFGIMPDWNPAEIIGVRPRPLALSLYKELVTDNIWAYQRDNYGYRNLRSCPLLMNFCGLPYIDVRVSFNSFIPADVPEDLARRLVNYYVEQLVANPSHHDKVEFEIIYSCYSLDLPKKMERLLEYGFSQEDCDILTKSLRQLTNNIINEKTGLWKEDSAKLSELKKRQEVVLNSDLKEIEKIYWLIEDCKRYGTLPFAGLARAGFIAVQLLKSMVSVSVFNEEDYNCFMNSLDTVSSCLFEDFQGLSRTGFLKKYGHLRPGTYDILSPRYDEDPDRYFDWSNEKNNTTRHERIEFSLQLKSLNQLEMLLKKHFLEHDVISLFKFIKGAIEGREYAKFVFTKSVSDILSIIKEMGKEYGLDEQELSYVDINVFKALYSSSDNPREAIERSIECGQKRYQITQLMSLPPLISRAEDIVAFHLPPNEPNFITLKSYSGKVVDEHVSKENLSGNILMIPHADPGCDWIFAHNIGGFITMYGGANSHMAIRAAELGIPAVIGVGEASYNQWRRAKMLEINCSLRQVHILK